LPVDEGTSDDNATRQGQRVKWRDRSMVSDAAETFAIHLKDIRAIRLTEASHARRDFCKALQIHRRP
jgi:hypothetical protein